MTVSDYNVAWLVSPGDPVTENRALEKRGLYIIVDGEDPTDLTPGDINHIGYRGLIFWYDAADTVSIHDGTSVIVTSDGKRFKSDGMTGPVSRIFRVEDKDLTTPPASTGSGLAYIAAVGATGDWSGKDKTVQVDSARGWLTVLPNKFDLALVADESQYYYYNASAVWVSGLPGSLVGGSSIRLEHMAFGAGIAVENQTTNTPPTATLDEAYIIGPSPSGVWAGNALSLAIGDGTNWTIHAPEEGWRVFDKALDKTYEFYGGVWNDAAPTPAVIASKIATTDVSSETAGTNALFTMSEILIAHAAQSTANKIKLTISGNWDLTPVAAGNPTIGFYRDSESNALFEEEVWDVGANTEPDTFPFSMTVMVTPLDTSSHDYKIKCGEGISTIASRNYTMTLEEITN